MRLFLITVTSLVLTAVAVASDPTAPPRLSKEDFATGPVTRSEFDALKARVEQLEREKGSPAAVAKTDVQAASASLVIDGVPHSLGTDGKYRAAVAQTAAPFFPVAPPAPITAPPVMIMPAGFYQPQAYQPPARQAFSLPAFNATAGGCANGRCGVAGTFSR